MCIFNYKNDEIFLLLVLTVSSCLSRSSVDFRSVVFFLLKHYKELEVFTRGLSSHLLLSFSLFAVAVLIIIISDNVNVVTS